MPFEIERQKIEVKTDNIYSFNKDKKDNKVAIFAMYSDSGEINNNTIFYLSELKKYNDYIILVADNLILTNELSKINGIVDYFMFLRHEEYDFGSYKRGFAFLKNNDYLKYISNIVFCNDSVTYTGVSLKPFFDSAYKNDFYGLTYHEYGYIKKLFRKKYKWGRTPHIQSYLFSVSANIFKEKKFQRFMKSIKKEKDKKTIIYKYEIGLSKLLIELGYSLNTYYPQVYDNVEIMGYFLDKDSSYDRERLFYKKNKYKFDEEDLRKTLAAVEREKNKPNCL